MIVDTGFIRPILWGPPDPVDIVNHMQPRNMRSARACVMEGPNIMAKSNVVKLPAAKKPSSNEALFPVSGDVMPIGGNAKKDRHTFNAVLDFGGIEAKDLYRMAAQTIVIKRAGNIRTAYAADTNKDKAGKFVKPFAHFVKEYMSGTINVKEAIVPKMRANAKVSKSKKIETTFETLSDAEKADMLKKLQTMLKK